MTFIFGWLLKIASSGVIDKITGYLTARSADATTQHSDDAKAATQIVVAQMQAEVDTRKVQAEQAGKHGWLVTFLALPFGLHVWAIVLDSIFHLGWKVAALPSPMDNWEGQIILSFFIVVPAAAAATHIVKSIWK